MLDAFAGTDLSRVRALRSQLHALDDALASLGGDEQQRAREADVLRYQVDEIAAAHLEDPEEEAALRLEEDRLADAGAYREAALEALELVDPAVGEGGVLDQLGQAVGALSGREAFDPSRERLAAAAIDLSDVARSLRDELEGWQDDPGRLGEVQERRRLLAELRRKYGEDLGAVMDFARQGTPAARRARGRRGGGGPSAGRARRGGATSWPTRRGRCVRRGPRRPARSGGWWATAWPRWPCPGPAWRSTSHPTGRGSRWSWPSGPTSASPSSRSPGRPLVGSWPGPCWPSGSSGSGARRPWSSTRSTPGWAVRRPWRWARPSTRSPAIARSWSSPTWHRCASRADAQVTVVKGESGGRTVTTATAVAGEDRVTELSRMLSGHPGSDAARAHARELLGASPGEVVHHEFGRSRLSWRGAPITRRVARRAEGGVSKFIFVTGGVSSSLGKGLTASSLGRLLKCRGLRVTMCKLDPYINVDPGP